MYILQGDEIRYDIKDYFNGNFMSSLNSGNSGSSPSVKDPLGILEGIVSAVHASVEKG